MPDDVGVVEVEAGDRVAALRFRRLLLEADRLAGGVEFDHAVALRITHLIPENVSTLIHG